MKKLFSFRLSEELMEDVRESANAEGISVTKLVENALEKHIQQSNSPKEVNSPPLSVEPNLNQPRGVDANLLRDLLLEILFDRSSHRGTSQYQNHEAQELKELKEQVRNLEHMMRAVFKENSKDDNPLSDYSQCNT